MQRGDSVAYCGYSRATPIRAGIIWHLKASFYSDMSFKPKSIIFLHPDLGIGGAERLVIDAAVGLQNLGHRVTILTSYCDKGHCFDEARNGACIECSL